MSTVVNGHREDESTSHTRTHGHILPMLSFSASTPTEEDNPLDNNPAIAIDMTLWEQPEDAVGSDSVDGGGRNPETVPLIDVTQDVVLIDGPNGDEDDEPDENAPLLAGGGGSRGGGGGIRGGGVGGGGGGGGGCSDDGDSGVGGLGIPVNMPRSPDDPDDQLEDDARATSVGELREVANQIVCEVISQAQAQATTKNNNKVEDNQQERLMEVVRPFVSGILATAKARADKTEQQTQNTNDSQLSQQVEETNRIVDPYTDERLMEVVRRFVSDIMAAAKAEAWDSMRQIQNNNNNVLSLKEEAAVAAEGGGGEGSVKGRSGPQTLHSPTSTHAERFFRGGPWYVQMGRVFSAFVSRICPCRCPTKP